MSKRKYTIAIADAEGLSLERISLNSLIEKGRGNQNEYEYIYALTDILDSVLDLKVDESIYFQPNRDDKTSKGIIRRFE